MAPDSIALRTPYIIGIFFVTSMRRVRLLDLYRRIFYQTQHRAVSNTLLTGYLKQQFRGIKNGFNELKKITKPTVLIKQFVLQEIPSNMSTNSRFTITF
jgi:hypothetical protein